MQVPFIIGYHANSEKKCKSYIKNNKIIYSEDKYWLGYGMYFWDLLSQAEYWAKEKKMKEYKRVWIVKSDILLDDVLDMSDNKVCELINELKNKFLKKENSKRKLEMGEALDEIFKYYKEFKPKVIKAVAYYESIGKNKKSIAENNRLALDKKKEINKTGLIIGGSSKIVYCVKDSNNLRNKKEVKRYY